MNSEELRLDLRQARRAFERAARDGADAAVLQREVERRMLERLAYIRLQPERILDVGCGAGNGLASLGRRYPKAELFGADFAETALRTARRSAPRLARVWRSLAGPPLTYVCADFSRLPFRSGSLALVWSNLALAWAAEPLSALREFHRVLSRGGLLMFSTYGPDTLKELKSAFAAASRGSHVHSFIDMHDLGDMLSASGFAAPVLDMETLTLTYTDVAALMVDLKTSGQTCSAQGRSRGLMGRAAWSRMLESYGSRRSQGRLSATVEVLYGHAWKGELRNAAEGRQVVKIEMRTKIQR